ncbi:PAS domain-containing protein [Sphingosinicella sp. BN140058]|uniref:PAS domain-containing sensor histidine kinase n=1 Tax=Sphingosinicella sp. BN140058 TaxID=1892855 RepID=UPI0010106498|nr:PAS domain-containing protein [Sphingosinicella sp. BN140058]QAY79059.1 PAS domain S-box protein [Sphingosinicella sp. BN140058]
MIRADGDVETGPATETARLKREMNDLVGLIGVGAASRGGEAGPALRRLAEALFGMSMLDVFVLDLVEEVEGTGTILLAGDNYPTGSSLLREQLRQLIEEEARTPVGVRRSRLLGGEVSLAFVPLGLDRRFGTLVAASTRADFPTHGERLLLNVGANQALLNLQEARLQQAQRRRTEELDARVAQRTRELAEANAALEAEIADRRLAEQALRASELNATALIENLPGFVAVLGPDGRVEQVNRQIEAYCGVGLEELRGWGTNGIVHPDDMPHVADIFGGSIAAGTPYQIEQRLRRFDGHYRWFDNRGRPLRDASGAIVAWHVLLTDVDDRKRAEVSLRASEQRLREQSETIPQMLWSATPDGHIDYCNERLLEYSGLTAEEVAGGGWVNLLHPDDRDRAAEVWGRSLETGEPYSVEVRHFHVADQSHRWILTLALPLRDAEGRIVKWYGSCADIHDRKLAEDALKASERHLAQIIDTIPAYVWSARGDGETDFHNKHYREFFGLRTEALQSWDWASVTHPADVEHAMAQWRGALASGDPMEAQTRIRGADGSYRWVLNRASALEEGDGSVKWFGVIIDIEEMKQAEERLRQSELNLRRLTETIPQNLFGAGADGLVNYLNPQLRHWFGRSDDTIMAEEWVHLVHPEDREPTIEAWTSTVAAGTSYRHEVRFISRDGSYRWCEVQAQPLRDEFGAILAWHGVVNDIHDRKVAEDALKASEQTLRLTIDTIPALVWSAEADGTADFFNQHYLDYVGRTRDNLAAWQWIGLVHPDDLAALGEVWALCRDSGQGAEAEARLQRHDGSYRWFRFQASPLHDADGNVVKWYGINTDIEDRKRVETELAARERTLREAHKHLSQAQRLSRTGSFTTDVQADTHVWSDELYAILEYDRKHAPTFAAFRDRIHAADRPAFDAGFRRSMADRVDFDESFRIVTPRGNMKYLHAVAHFQEDSPDRPIVIGSIQDVTESRHAEDQLRRSAHYLSAGERVSMTGSFAWDVETDEIAYSDQLREIHELEAERRLRGADFRSRFHPDDLPIFEKQVGALAQGVDSIDYEMRLRMPDGRIKHVHAFAKMIQQADGRRECVGAVQDVTRRRQAEESLQRVRGELAHVARVTSLGQLTASIAHEVSQPLAGIITNANTCLRMLAADPPDVDGAIATARRTLRDGNRATEVIRRLRSLFRKTEQAFEPLDLNDAAREIVALSSQDLQRRGIVIAAEFDDLLPVAGDRVQLQQVILNLVLNAADALDEVTDRQRLIVIETQQVSPVHVELTVRDTGPGLADEDSKRVFEPFYTTKAGGMGIGLSVSKSILEHHDGRLWVESDRAGTAFSFSVPVAQASDPAAGDLSLDRSMRASPDR